MSFDPTPRRRRPRGGLIAAAAVGAFILTAAGLATGLSAVDPAGSTPAAAEAPAGAGGHDAHATPAQSTDVAAPARAAEDAGPAAPKNTMSADAPAYRPAACSRSTST